MKFSTLLASTIIAASAFGLNAAELPADIQTLYLVGEASPSGWNLDNAPEMVKGDDGIFSWSGHLGTGQFKMTLSRTDWDALVSATQDNCGVDYNTPMAVAYNTATGDQDWKWYNNVEGEYTLTVDTKAATLTVAPVISDEITALYIVGSASPAGWDRDTAPQLTDAGNGIFTWAGSLKAGDFKFVTARNSWNSLCAAEPDTPVTLSTAMTAAINAEGGDKDYKWVIAEDGDYTLTVNLEAMSLLVTSGTTGISSIDADNSAAPVVYYNLQGVRVDNPSAGSLYIRVQGTNVTKIVK